MKKALSDIIKAINESRSVLIVGHVSPDGDCFGSMFALGMSLEKFGKKVICSAGDGLTAKYSFMKDYVPNCAASELEATNFDLGIAVDTADDYRMGSILQPVFFDIPKTVSIDHHMTNPGFCDLNWVENKSAAAELIYELILALGTGIDKRIANALYAGIMTDTGNFAYTNTSPETLIIASELLKLGAEVPMMHEEIYSKRSAGATRLIGAAIGTLELYSEGKIAVMKVSWDMIEKSGALPADCEELINYAREIDSVEAAILVREINPNRHKISLRGKKYADVAKLAGYFGGGGHKFAAGCTLDLGMEEAKAAILSKVEEIV